MRSSRNQAAMPEKVEINNHEFATGFKYLGAVVTNKNSMEAEIKAQIAAGNRYAYLH